MDLYAAERALSIRLYHWSSEEYARQRQDDYPMLRMINNRGAGIFLRLVSPLTKEQEALLGTALLKRAHPKAIQHLGLAMTEEEQALPDRYAALYCHELMRAQSPKPLGTLLERRKLVGKVIQILKPTLGKPADRDVYDT